MTSVTPEIQLRTMFALDRRGRIISTREPQQTRNTLFVLIRGASSCAWAIGAGVHGEIAAQLNRLAATEPPIRDFREGPLHADRYLALAGGRIESGPALTFPDLMPSLGEAARIDKLELLERHFRGWRGEEIPECSPIMGAIEDGYPVSVCFCARRTETAAEAGVETTADFRGRGLAPRVTAAWAVAIRASGRTPLYSTSWSNAASLAVARKLALVAYASDWSLVAAGDHL